jgi:ketosteroid isomerase-like protein
MMEPYAQDAVFDLSAVFTDSSPARGHHDIRLLWQELRETWGGGVRHDPLELLEVGDRQYVLEVRMWGKGTRSGVEIDQRFAFLYVMHPQEDKILSARLFPDVAAAVAEAESSAFPAA